MLSNDVGNLFGSMKTIYGALWTHGSDEMETWRKALANNGVNARDLQLACNNCLKEYPSHPPTMGQLLGLIASSKPKTARARRIEKKEFSLVMAQANRIMFALLMQTGGVKTETLKLLIAAKNAMVTDAENTDQDEVEFAAKLDKQLRELITGHEERRTA
jgi:hypothetical protein